MTNQTAIYAYGFCPFCGKHSALRRQVSPTAYDKTGVVHEFVCRPCYDSGHARLAPCDENGAISDATAERGWVGSDAVREAAGL